MDSESVIILIVNRNTSNIVSHLQELYSVILREFYEHKGHVTISIDNDDWLWLIDHWASFYLSGTLRQVPSQTFWERLFPQIKTWMKIKSPSREIFYSIDTGYLKKFRDEMSDGKYLFMNGYKIPVKVM